MEKQDITKVEPLRDYITAELIVKASKAGIILSETAKENAEYTLKAVKCGPDVKGVKAGDTLMVNPFDFMSQKVKFDNEHYFFPESVVIAIRRLT